MPSRHRIASAARVVLTIVVLAGWLAPAAPAGAVDEFGPGGFGPDGFGGFPAAVTAGASLTESSLVLGQVDLLSGQIIGDSVGVAVGDAQHLAATLSDTSQLAFDAQLAAETARARAEARRRAEAERLAAAARTAGAQTEIGPDGCPVAVPTRTLRGGAEAIGAHALCVRSVAQAPTPAAAVAIKYTFANLGVPYSQPRRMTDGYFDCSSYVSKAYASAGVPTIRDGWAPTTRQLAPYPGYSSYPWLTTVPWEERRAGDLTLTPPTRSDGGGHVMMQLADGYMIHTAATGDVSHVTREWSKSRILVVRRVVP